MNVYSLPFRKRHFTSLVWSFLLCCFAFAVSAFAAGTPAAATIGKESLLQGYARSVIESKSPADRRKLEQVAREAAKDPAQAALANLSLGYYYLTQSNYAGAGAAFAAARTEANPLRDYADFYAAVVAAAQGNQQEAADILNNFQVRNASSPLAPRAALESAKLLIQLQKPQ